MAWILWKQDHALHACVIEAEGHILGQEDPKGIYGDKLSEIAHTENASPTIVLKDFTAAVIKKQQEL